MRDVNEISNNTTNNNKISDNDMNKYKQHLSSFDLTDQRKEEVIYALDYFIRKIIDNAFEINTTSKQHPDKSNNDICNRKLATPNRSPRTAKSIHNNDLLKKQKTKQQ